MQITFTPKDKKNDEGKLKKTKFTGTIVLETLTWDERAEQTRIMAEATTSVKRIQAMQALVKNFKAKFVKVDVTKKSGEKTHYDSIDKLMNGEPAAQDLVFEVAGGFLTGFDEGNDSPEESEESPEQPSTESVA